MSKLDTPLYITYSSQRVRDLRLDNTISPFATIITLEHFVSHLGADISTEETLNDSSIPPLLFTLIQSEKISYFEYLKPTSESLKVILRFFAYCGMNSVAIDTIHEGEKAEALESLYTSYTKYKKDNNLIEAMQSFTDKKLVMSAYSQPQQKTIPLRIEATKNFANHSAQKCFKWSIL